MATEVPDGESFVNFYANLYRSYRRRNQRERSRERKNWDMFSGVDGKQWDPDAYQQLVDEGRAPHQVNFIQKNVLTLAGNFYRNDNEFDFEPNTGASNDDSLLLKHVYLTDKNMSSWKKANRKLIQAGLIYRGTVELFKDFKNDRLGRTGLRYINHDTIMYDPDWTSDNVNDNKHIIQYAWMTPPEIKLVYNKSSDEIENAIKIWNRAVSTRQEDATDDSYSSLYDDSPEFTDILNHRFLVIQVSRLERGIKRSAIDVDRNTTLPDMSQENMDSMMALRGQSLKVIQNKFSKLKVCTIVPGLSLNLRLENDADHQIQTGSYQYKTWSSLNVNGEVQGVVDTSKDLQEMYNKRESTFTHWQTSAANGAEFVEEDFFSDPTEYDRYVQTKNVPGETYKVGSGKLSQSRMGIASRPRGEVPNDLHTSADRAFNMMSEVTPVVPAISGETERSGESSKLFEAKRGQALVALEPMRLSLQEYQEDLGETWFFFAKQLYSGAPREMFIPDLNGTIPLNVPTQEGGVINDFSQIRRHNIIVKVSQNGDTARRELLDRYANIMPLIKNPINQSFIEERMISLLPNIPDDDVRQAKENSEIFIRLQGTRVEAEISQNEFGIAQFNQQKEQLSAPQQQPNGGLGPSGEGQTPADGGGISVEGASLEPGNSLPVDVNNINQLK